MDLLVFRGGFLRLGILLDLEAMMPCLRLAVIEK